MLLDFWAVARGSRQGRRLGRRSYLGIIWGYRGIGCYLRDILVYFGHILVYLGDICKRNQAREATRQEVPWRTFQLIKIDPTMAALEIKMKLTISKWRQWWFLHWWQQSKDNVFFMLLFRAHWRKYLFFSDSPMSQLGAGGSPGEDDQHDRGGTSTGGATNLSIRAFQSLVWPQWKILRATVVYIIQ